MKLLLFLDYDGTLTPIAKRPKLARLSPPRKIFLRKLAHNPRIKMAIISGRKLSDIKRLVNIPQLIYVGNHGFEIEVNGNYKIHPAARRFIPTLKRIKSKLINKITVKGAWIEDKSLTLSVHYREVARGRLKLFYQLFYKAINPWEKKIKITKGKKIFEIRPPFDWDKGKAVKWIINKLHLKNYFPIYIGDDQTDEDAFRALKGKGLPAGQAGISIFVGKTKRTSADYSLKNVSAVYRFLQILGAL